MTAFLVKLRWNACGHGQVSLEPQEAGRITAGEFFGQRKGGKVRADALIVWQGLYNICFLWKCCNYPHCVRRWCEAYFLCSGLIWNKRVLRWRLSMSKRIHPKPGAGWAVPDRIFQDIWRIWGCLDIVLPSSEHHWDCMMKLGSWDSQH